MNVVKILIKLWDLYDQFGKNIELELHFLVVHYFRYYIAAHTFYGEKKSHFMVYG